MIEMDTYDYIFCREQIPGFEEIWNKNDIDVLVDFLDAIEISDILSHNDEPSDYGRKVGCILSKLRYDNYYQP